MNDGPEKSSTKLRHCIEDTLTFLIEQLKQAMSPADQFAAVTVAKAVIPLLASHLREDQRSNAHLAFSYPFGDYIAQPDWSDRWDDLAGMPPPLFAQTASVIDCLGECINQIAQLPASDEIEEEP
ncbi:hypothetical protein [Bradyrhizobium sp. CCGUVB23]|uniref:hypothetical protein n=1 Tax=Bradyrhizobium sp. CCGUVB23 TaxID=2949630 RepID=UPI0020B36378|nr:hypothetical protein [Bradyrhizobium sp. CCGUVB23]MCP3459730.1 hypothetical protein [Bradyrhizobium sp. CCGUVB23]